MTKSEKLYQELAALRTQLPSLVTALHLGTPPRWHAKELTDAQLRAQDELARAEKADKILTLKKGLKIQGSSKAPLNISVLDVDIMVKQTVAELEEAVCERLGNTPEFGSDTATKLTRIIGFIDAIMRHGSLADHVLAEVVRVRRMASKVLGEDEPVIRLKGRCPICDAVSLRAFMDRDVIACLNRECRCDDEGCQCHLENPRRHMWLFEQWTELNDFLDSVGSAA